ncbi:MAG TPA: hypothetical protein PLH15_05045 [Spirochaetota bacterium]|nr:hypothetical protein [Spirochaetota bacterium]
MKRLACRDRSDFPREELLDCPPQVGHLGVRKMIRKFPFELEEQIRKEYKPGINGYMKLAKKYGLTRDYVRYWILKKPNTQYQEILLNKEEKDELKRLKKELKYLRDANMYWKNYAELLQQDISDSKKKDKKSKLSKNQKKMEPES